MTLKLTVEQANRLYNLFADNVLHDVAKSEAQYLIMLHMKAIFKKLRTKLEGKTGKHANLNLTEFEAVAYRLYFDRKDLSGYGYEQNFIRQQLSDIYTELYTKHITVPQILRLNN